MKKLLNCPNCGAPVEAEKCAYCGTVFLDFAAIQMGEPCYVKFKIDDTYICARLILDTLDIETSYDNTWYTNLGGISQCIHNGMSVNFHMDARAVCNDGDSFVAIIRGDEEE